MGGWRSFRSEAAKVQAVTSKPALLGVSHLFQTVSEGPPRFQRQHMPLWRFTVLVPNFLEPCQEHVFRCATLQIVRPSGENYVDDADSGPTWILRFIEVSSTILCDHLCLREDFNYV